MMMMKFYCSFIVFILVLIYILIFLIFPGSSGSYLISSFALLFTLAFSEELVVFAFLECDVM